MPVVALLMVTMVGFLALSVDVGMLSIAKTQTQQAADLAALTAARTVNGNSSLSYNVTAATTNAQNCLTYNLVLGTSIPSTRLSLTYGSYDYNQTTQAFSANYPATTGQSTSAVSATVSSGNLPVAFGSAFGSQFLPSISATAQAVHRPRDIALVMDLSGSMRFGTCLGFDWYTSTRASNNPDTVYPKFSHYSSSSAVMQGPNTNQTSSFASYIISPSNTTAANSSYALTYVNSFYQNAAYASTLIRAFDSYTSTDGGATWTAPLSTATPQLPPNSYATTPGGDVPLFVKNSTTTYATTVKDVLGSSTRNAAWELDGYSNYTSGSLSNAASGQSNYTSAPFKGYTQGPAYYGKTFFIWPPDPREILVLNGNSTTIFKQFFTDFGYTSTDFNTSTYWQPLYGIYNAASTTSGGHNWPWPNDGGVSLGTYLTTKVYIPGGSRKLKSTDSQYQQIMRLYNWNYVVDNLGTTPCDWRIRFFGVDDNTLLFNSSGSLNLPGSSTYTINYNEILRWITQTPNPFPTQLRGGRIKYYGSIPTAITGTWPNYGSTDQRFWAEFIDYVLGFRQTSAGVYQDVSGMTGYGTDFSWGTIGITTVPSVTQCMSYTDNPARPLSRYWFGPMAMVDFLQNYNFVETGTSNYFAMQPGDSYEAPIYTAKDAFVAAIATMQNNHPNDWVSVIMYSSPRGSSSDTWGRFNCARSPLGNNYKYATASLLFPFGTINADGSTNSTEINPYTADPTLGTTPSLDFADTPRANGSTCFAMGLMLCYNQFAVTPATDGTLRNYVTSSPITFPTGIAGGLGRKGAQKVVIFETDGISNYTATANLQSAGTYSYYKIRFNMNNPTGSEYPTATAYASNDPTVTSQIYSLVQQLSTDYGTSRNPFKLYAIGFGPVFQSTQASSALTTLQNMQYYGGTQTSASTALPSNQVIIGTDTQMSTAMINTYTQILQNGVQIALIK